MNRSHAEPGLTPLLNDVGPGSPGVHGNTSIAFPGNPRASVYPKTASRGNGFKASFLVLGSLLTLTALWVYSERLPSSLFPSSFSSSASWNTPGGIKIHKSKHPIDVLLQQGQDKFETMRDRQSKTVVQAVKEYKRRYGRLPPKGFEGWWSYAQERGTVFVDEFDTIERDLRPFWGLSPTQIDERRKSLLATAKSDRLMSITIRDGVVDDEDGPASSKKWDTNKAYHLLFEGYSKDLPDLNIVLNLNDQPIGFVSWEERQRLIEAGQKGIFAPDDEEIPASLDLIGTTRGLAFEDLRAACPPDSLARTYTTDPFGQTVYPLEHLAPASFRLPDSQGSFVFDPKTSGDICTNPALREQNGNFLKPELYVSMKRNRLYPVFSWSRYHASSDITIPTNYRFSWGTETVPAWEQMYDAVAWRGTLTGMYPDTAAVLDSHRHRLFRHIQDKWGHTDILQYNGSKQAYEMGTMRKGNGEAWMDVGFLARKWNRKTEAEVMVEGVLQPSPRMDNKERNKFKMLLDIDGWGWSARYRELMRTSSAVLKTTVYHEWVSDWMIPWYHYIPLNYDYRDLYSVLLYFFGVEGSEQKAHDEELRGIAGRSKEWAESQFSWEQHKVYMYRLCLEWARICSENRREMDYVG